ncbi:MAG: RsmE family RNA methyltransferase [bacterium]|nr:RsmE family RNA methyltransferase [bacterium]
MRFHRFFIPQPISIGESVVIRDADLLHQWQRVFRYRSGREVILFDGSGYDYRSVIEKISKSEAELKVLKMDKAASPLKAITLYLSLLKKNNFELVLEKGTEIGISAFVPVQSDRSEKKGFNIARCRKIIKEAAEQSGRGILPALSEKEELSTIIERAEIPLLAFDSAGKTFDSSQFKNFGALGVLIGPEGGWSDGELELFKKKNVEIQSLGPLTLRAETAAIVGTFSLLIDK